MGTFKRESKVPLVFLTSQRNLKLKLPVIPVLDSVTTQILSLLDLADKYRLLGDLLIMPFLIINKIDHIDRN
jgi:hypothetical protein